MGERGRDFSTKAGEITLMILLEQGVVTYTSPVEAFATGIKNFDR